MPLSWAVLRAAAPDGRLTCAAAFAVCEAQSATPAQVGEAANGLGLRLTGCQLGLFGKSADAPDDSAVDPRLVRALAGHAGRGLPCVEAWGIADTLALARRQVGAAADIAGVKIVACQLGCF
ncbi:MAG: hypothetical protein ACYC5O_18500 [Anaerolineae bacterium]